jgi:drug/metabolite transporter (DMT)-like permease
MSQHPHMPRRLVIYLMAFGSVLFWGASFPLTKAALAYVGPTSLAFLRWTVSALALTMFIVTTSSRRAAGALDTARTSHAMFRRHWWTVLWVSATGITLFYFLENAALRYTTATNAGVLSNLISVFMVLIGTVILRERLSGAEWTAMLAAFAGAVLVSLGAGHLTVGGPGLLGDVLMVAAAFFGAIYSIGGKGLSERYPPILAMTAIAGLGALLLLPLALLEGLTLSLPLGAWAIILLLGIGSGALANLWWLVILRYTEASRAAFFLLVTPIISASLAVPLLHEPLTPMLVVGALLVLAGVLVVERHTEATPADQSVASG